MESEAESRALPEIRASLFQVLKQALNDITLPALGNRVEYEAMFILTPS